MASETCVYVADFNENALVLDGNRMYLCKLILPPNVLCEKLAFLFCHILFLSDLSNWSF